MQIINFDKNFDNRIVQENWKSGLLPHFSGIVIGDGKMIEMEEQYTMEGTSQINKISPIRELIVNDFLETSGEFVQIVIMESRIYIPEIKCHAICGEGEMGNEGFVALVRDKTLVWSAFFTISNPFYEINRNMNFILAKSTHENFWSFPIFEPWKAYAE